MDYLFTSGFLGTRAPLFMDIAAVVARVQEESPQALFERESVRRALERSFQKKAALLPQISLRAEQSRQQYGRGFAGEQFEVSPFNSFGSRVVGTLSIFDTDRYATYRIAQLEHAIAEQNYEVAVQDIMDQAVMLYFTHLRDLRQVEIVQGNLERSGSLLKLAWQQFDAGVAVKIDITRAEVRVASDRRDLMAAQTAVQASMLEFQALLDIDFEREVRLDRSVVNEMKAPPSLKRYAKMGVLAEQRQELVSQQIQLEQAELASRAAGWQRLPSVELFGDWGYDSEEIFDDNDSKAWLVGVRASIPLFEGGRISAEKREAKAAVRQNEYKMRDLRNRIEREFRYAMLEMDSRYDQMGVARDEVRLGEDEVSQAEVRYREGLADNRELIDAQQRLADAEDSHLRATYFYGLSRLGFARAIGMVERVLD